MTESINELRKIMDDDFSEKNDFNYDVKCVSITE